MSNLQTYYHFILDFQKVDQHTGDKRRKDDQFQSPEQTPQGRSISKPRTLQ